MSEEELLLLSNYVYMEASTDPMTIGESLDRFRNAQGTFDENSVAAAGIGGGMTRAQAADLFTRMDAMPSSFQELYPSRIKNSSDLRGICYTQGEKDGGAGTVVFRGTGGTYNAWHDNVLGEYLPSTEIQKQAADFVNYDCMGFDQLTVTGHSKGGNLAMYTTVMCASVAACVSFDGQGFSLAFLQENMARIAEVSGKIKSVSAHNDFVNILLHCIAGERVFAQNPANGIDAHSSYYLLTGNTFDENGNLISTREQSVAAFALQEALKEVTEQMDALPDGGNREISALLAAYVAAIMSEDRGEVYEQEQIRAAQEDVGRYLLRFLPGYDRTLTESVAIHTLQKDVKTEALENGSGQIELAGKYMRNIRERLTALAAGVDPEDRIGYYVNQQLNTLKEDIQEQISVLDGYSNTLLKIRDLYVRKEQDLAAQIAGV